MTFTPPQSQYMALQDTTVTNTTAETSALAAVCSGSRIIPANRLVRGTTITIRGGGVYTTPLLAPGTLTIRVKLGGAVIATTNVTQLLGGMTAAAYDLSCTLMCRAPGASGLMAPIGGLNFATGAGGRVYSDLLNSGADVQIDTTAANELDVTVQWATASTTRSITMRGAVVTVIN